MNKDCLICKRRDACLVYELGGLFEGERCDRFMEEPELTEQEQERLQQDTFKIKKVIDKWIGKIKSR